jgi:tetratricopeptide (TPR) repeat protein
MFANPNALTTPIHGIVARLAAIVLGSVGLAAQRAPTTSNVAAEPAAIDAPWSAWARGDRSRALAGFLQFVQRDPADPLAGYAIAMAADLAHRTGATRTLRTSLASHLAKPGLPPATGDAIRIALMEAAFADGDLNETSVRTDELGFLTDWWLIGPFDNERGAGLARVFPPETRVDLTAVFDGKQRPVRWRRIPVADAPTGKLDIGACFRPNTQMLVYAATVLHADEPTDVLLQLGSAEAFAVFVGGREVARRDVRRRFAFDQDAIPVQLAAGPNLVLVKLCNQEGDASFALRMTALDLSPVRTVRAAANPDDDAAAAAAAAVPGAPTPNRTPTADRGAFDRLQERASNDPAAALRLAEWLLLRHPDDQTERRDLGFAQQAAAAMPSDPRARFRLAQCRVRTVRIAAEKEENARRHDLEAVLALDGDHVEALVELARLELDGLGPTPRAEAMARRATELAPTHGDALLLHSQILQRMSLAPLAARTVETALRDAPNDPNVLARAAAIAEAQGRLARAAELQRASVAARHDADRVAKAAELAVRTGEADAARRMLAAALVLDPFARVLHRQAARLHELAGDVDAAIAGWTEWLRICPEDDAAFVELARLHACAGNVELQRGALAAALDLNPARKDERRQLEFLAADELPFHAAFERDTNAALAADSGPPNDAAAASDPFHCILEQRVVHAMRGGTTSTYSHLLVRVTSEAGARRLDGWSVPHHRGEQRARLLTVRVVREGEADLTPQIRGPSAALPPLRVGDVVEIRQRVDDVAPTFFGDMFHFVHVFGATFDMPTADAELVLVLDPGRDYRFQPANGAPAGAESTDASGRKVVRFAMRGIARGLVEEQRPEDRELRPLVRVSTHASWDALGAWWWNLIRNQIEVSPAMRAKVAELTAGLTTEAEKIAALHRFVTTDIRYTAWEFGVHGYKPYATPVIFERRHGDCKDKALLLNAMLGEIGVEAWPVLIHADALRTNDDLTLPLVGHFNHCISWLPASGERGELFLDGTAIYHDPSTVPSMDQGAQVCIVQGERSRLARVPVTTAEANVLRRTASLTLARNGDAAVEIEVQATANRAVPVRQELGNEPARARTKLERILGDWFGRFELRESTSSALDDLAEPVRWTARGTATGFLPPRGGVVLLPATLVQSPLSQATRSTQRAAPLLLGIPEGETERLRYALPDGFVPDPLPPPIHLDTPFGRYEQRWTADGDAVVVERSLYRTVARVPAAEYPEFREFVDAIETADRRTLALRSRQ